MQEAQWNCIQYECGNTQAGKQNSNIVSGWIVYTSVSGILVVRMWREGCGYEGKRVKRRGWVVNVAVHEEEAMVAVPLS